MTEPEHDRPNALLTKRQRRFLAGDDDTEWNSSYGRTLRTRIRRRVRGSLFDFSLLLNLSDEDISRIFAPAPADSEAVEGNLVGASMDTVAFLLLGHTSQNPNPVYDLPPSLHSFETVVSRAVAIALAHRGEVAEPSPDVTISVEREEFADDLDLSEFTLSQLNRLLNAEQITPEQYADAVKARSDSEGSKEDTA